MKRPIVITLLVVALLFVLAGIGAVVFFTIGTPEFGFVRHVESATVEESKTLKVDADKPLTLKVTDDAGNVTITGADVETVQIKTVKTAYATSQARADEEVKTIKYTIDQVGNTITLNYELPTTTNFNKGPNTVDFIVMVPNEVTVDVNSNMGEVGIADIKGKVTVENDFGEVDVENIAGALSVSNNSGEITATSIKAGAEDIELNSDFGAVTLKNASGNDIKLTSNSGRITFNEVRATGDVTTKSDFGDTVFENGSSNSLSIESNSGRVSLLKLKVSKQIKVDDDFGEIELEQAFAGSYDLHTNSGSITIDGAKGTLKANTDFGGIKIGNAQAVTLDLETNSGTVEFSGSLGEGPHLVKSDFGEIDLTLPADSALNVDLKTDFGSIKSDLPVTVTLNGSSNSDGDEIVGSINGGGAQLTVQTNSGSVTIHAGK